MPAGHRTHVRADAVGHGRRAGRLHQDAHAAAPSRCPHLSLEQIAAVVQRVDDLCAVISDAGPVEKQKLYEQPGMKMIYRPGREKVHAPVAVTNQALGDRHATRPPFPTHPKTNSVPR